MFARLQFDLNDLSRPGILGGGAKRCHYSNGLGIIYRTLNRFQLSGTKNTTVDVAWRCIVVVVVLAVVVVVVVSLLDMAIFLHRACVYRSMSRSIN